MESTEAKKTPKLKRFRKWMKRCWRCLSRRRENTEERQESPSIQTSYLEEAAMESSESSPCSPERSAPSEPGSLHNESLMSCFQTISSRTQSVSAELAATSKLPCCAAHPLASRCNLAHPAHNHNPGRYEHAGDRRINRSIYGEAGEQTQSQGTLRSESMVEHLSQRTSMEEIIDAEPHASAENVDSCCEAPTPLFNLPSDEELSSQSEGQDDGDDLSISQPDMHRHLVASLRAVNQLSSASNGSSLMLKRLQCFIPLSKSPPISQRCTFAPPLEKKSPDMASQDNSRCSTVDEMEEYASQKRTTTTDTLQSSTEVLGACAPDNPENLEMFNVLCQGEEEYKHSQALNECNRDIVSRPEERLSEELPVQVNQCRFCHGDETSPENPLLSPCQCSGSMKFVHFDCLKKWLQIRIESGSFLLTVQNCEVCTARLMVDPETFDWIDFYQEHRDHLMDEQWYGDPWRGIVMRLQALELVIVSLQTRRTSLASRQSMMERRREQRQPSDDT